MKYLFILLIPGFAIPASAQYNNNEQRNIETDQQSKNKSNMQNIKHQTKFHPGLYRGFEYQVHTGPIMSESGTYQRFFTFYDDGRVFMGSALEGMDAFNPDDNTVHGHYQIDGNTVYIQWVRDGNISSQIAPDGSLVFYGKKYAPLPNCNGMKLNGYYGRRWENEYIERRMIAFTTGGYFADMGILTQTALETSEKYLKTPPTWSAEFPLMGKGTYFIRNNTLYLNYENGARETIEIYIKPQYNGIEPVPEIVIGGWEFERKQMN